MTDFVPGEDFFLACLQSPTQPRPQAVPVTYVRDTGRTRAGPTVRVRMPGGAERAVFVGQLYKVQAEALARAAQMEKEI